MSFANLVKGGHTKISVPDVICFWRFVKCCAALMMSQILCSQDTAPLLPSKDPIVTVDLQVVDERSTAPITGLQEADFDIVANGTSVQVLRASFDVKSLDLVLVIDEVSQGSRTRQPAFRALCKALSLNWREADKLGVVQVTQSSLIRSPLSHDLDLVESEIGSGYNEKIGTASIPDGVAAALEILKKEAIPKLYRKQVLLLVTRDPKIQLPALKTVQERVLRDGITVYALSLATVSIEAQQQAGVFFPGRKFKPPKRMETWSVSRSLQTLVEATGGETIRSAELDPYSIRRCLSRIKERYLISFKSQSVQSNRPQNLKVSLRPNAIPSPLQPVLRYRSAFWTE